MNTVPYTGKNDLRIDLPNDAFDLSYQSQLDLGREFQFALKNTHATQKRTAVIFANGKSNLANLIKDGLIVYVAGATDFECTGAKGLVADWLRDIAERPQIVLDCDVVTNNANQMSEEFKIMKWDFYNGFNLPSYVKLNTPGLRTQQDSKKNTVRFNLLTTTKEAELSIVIPPLTETTFTFRMGAALSDAYFLQQLQLVAKSNGVAI